ncbi:MAG: acetyl-CoA carboxylase carboxyltransferase subunit alpha [Pseudomonadota bacterium]|nr:acetyl-CoA carboxylase carboxyltransferase subunit alpha [Pseudomonadota bacterium]
MEHIPLEQPIVELEERIAMLRHLMHTQGIDKSSEIKKLQQQAKRLRSKIFSRLSAYDTVKLSRHPQRPNSLEIIKTISTEFIEMHGDRHFYDDRAIVGGLAHFDEQSVMFIGHQKGRGTSENITRNFGMPKPEGYRKALRLMHLAAKFSLPIICFIDTPGAYPGIGAEERGQSEAIGRNILAMARLSVPIIAIVIGEGGSGGALAIGVADRTHMLKYSIYSVISPEGCASILMKNAGQATEAAAALKLTATHALELGLIDSIIDEPLGGGHWNPADVAKNIKDTIRADLQELAKINAQDLPHYRSKKFADVKFYSE